MNSTHKGNKLEDAFYKYLLDQKSRGDLVYGLHPPENCKILRKKEYYCREREDYVQFDIVLELYRQGRSSAHSYVVFECKNYEGGIPETCVTDFSDKLGRIFKHAAKGVLVVSSRLQSGADKVARSRSMGIVKYDEDGLEVVADRSCVESRFVKSQIFRNDRPVKSLKFSAYHDGNFFGAINQFLRSVEPELSVGNEIMEANTRVSVPYVPAEHIKRSAQEILEQIGYKSGPVDLGKICSVLSIDLHFSQQVVQDEDGTLILGSANFDRNSIQINVHANSNRERFTIGHEIGHFCLKHKMYLRSETIVERDLLIDFETDDNFNYDRLEFQANAFSSELILPDQVFLAAIDVGRFQFDIRDRGHGYIFVDDQPCNFLPYDQLISRLSLYFEVSKQAIEIKLRKMGLLNDQRKRNQAPSTARLLRNFHP
ncbi:ImmA/IrrE family metallo-endopeptidase [Rhizobium leguminosarum]|uniref:ImmA/IrrE family metallo-endopeptidase n=1 Tax=Rhizobium leguminosarum TaxID=384 RepID=UPI00140F7994|nr:ImmA/IrrE family metallo-endopeptidase [Rhizobium leguminosarum]QIO59221.1 ImmA/IrrE family metallo-endopeptidase [Rhizobium leguminosarum bv. trifolii]